MTLKWRVRLAMAVGVVLGVAVTLASNIRAAAPQRVDATRTSTVVKSDDARPVTPTIRQFGAVGDGVADDTAAIQAAIDACRGEVRVPGGTYRITRTLQIPLDRVGPIGVVAAGPARVVMAGPGPAIRLIGTHAGTASPSSVDARVWKRQRSPMIDGLEIVGAHADACGIEASGTMQLTLTRVVVRKTFIAIHLVNRNRNVTIANCHLYENRGAGVFYDHVNLHQSIIVGCHISYNAGGGIVVFGGEVRNIQIGTCDIEANMGDQPSGPTANVLLESTGGSIGEVAITGCTIQHSHLAPNSANIRINGESAPRTFTKETRHGNITIADNVLSDVGVNVEVRNARGVTITGNTIWKGYQHNMLIETSQSIVVANNVFDRNPRYHYGDGAQAKLGVVFRDCAGATVNANHIDQVGEGTAAMVVQRCRHFNITACTILDCSPCGLLLDGVTSSRVSDCLIDEMPKVKNGVSLKVQGGQRNLIVDNLLGYPRP